MNTRVRGVCSVEGCGRPHYAKTWCSTHYSQVKRRGQINPPKLPKGRMSGPRKPIQHGTHYAFQFHRCRCEQCVTYNREYNRTWNENNRKARREIQRKTMYGMERGHYDALLVEQGCRCAICGDVGGPKGLYVDHCHDSGAIRGLLCGKCNAGIGMLKDDPDVLLAAAAYLLKNSDVLGSLA